MKKIFAATIGLGFGKIHAKIFNKSKLTKLICVSDKNKKKKTIAKSLKTVFVDNTNHIFNNKKINLVSIATYDNYHFQYLYKAIKTNKNIFVEKPMCQNIKQFSIIKKLQKKTKIQ